MIIPEMPVQVKVKDDTDESSCVNENPSAESDWSAANDMSSPSIIYLKNDVDQEDDSFAKSLADVEKFGQSIVNRHDDLWSW